MISLGGWGGGDMDKEESTQEPKNGNWQRIWSKC